MMCSGGEKGTEKRNIQKKKKNKKSDTGEEHAQKKCAIEQRG